MAATAADSTLDDSADHDFIEVPSCIESLASSAGQLRQLAHQADHYYGKVLICYGYTNGSSSSLFSTNQGQASPLLACCRRNNNTSASSHRAQVTHPRATDRDRHKHDIEQLDKDKTRLESINSTVRILPFLNELVSFLERCQVTIESTLKRLTYYLNLACQQEKQYDSNKAQSHQSRSGAFQLTRDVRLDAIFVALMDLIFSLVSLDKTLSDHTNLKHDLNLFYELTKLVSSQSDQSPLLTDDTLTKKRLVQLNGFISTIHLSLGGGANDLLCQCVEHVQHLNLILSKDKTRPGFKLLEKFLEEFLLFYAEYLIDVSSQSSVDCSQSNPKLSKLVSAILIGNNLIPTIHMTTLSRRLFGLISLNILFNSIFHRTKENKKINQAINQVIQRAKPSNIILLEGNCHLMLDEFIQAHIPKSSKSIESKSYDQLSAQMEALLKVDARVEFERLASKTSQWLMKLQCEALDHMHMQMAQWPKRQILLLDQGLRLAQEISTTMSHISAAHLHRNSQIGRDNLEVVCRLAVLAKSIRENLNRHELFISNCLLKIEHFVLVRWRKLVKSFQKRQISMKYSSRKMELSSSLKLISLAACSELLSDQQGRIIESMCLSMLLPLMDPDELLELNLMLDLMRLDSYERIAQVTDCSLLYWHIPSLGAFYNRALEGANIITSPATTTHDINMLHLALDDVPHLFGFSERPTWAQADLSWLLEERDRFLYRLGLELLEQFKIDYLDRVCQELEVELRLQTHKDLYTDEQTNPNLARRSTTYDFKQILCGRMSSNCMVLPTTFKLMNRRINLNFYVEQYLNRVCYNLTAIAPHDWFTYDNMLNFARHKYQLEFVDTQLPAQTLDSGLDLLDIIRNPALFGARYSYDLTNQLFIEKCSSYRSSVASSIQRVSGVGTSNVSSNQVLNVLQSHHIARSIQTHGYGILDSAVNCTYLTLKRLINLFARQLSDDKLRAVLQKEHQQMIFDFNRTDKQVAHWRLPYERANRMAKQFRLQASTLTEMSEFVPNSSNHRPNVCMDLDSIRQTVTQLGNLLAFIRLIKSGALSCASKSVDYVPEMSDLTNLRLSKCVEQEFQDYKTHPTLWEATKNFDQCLSDLEENFSPKTNYTKIIVALFSGLLQGKPESEESETPHEPREKAKEDNSSTPNNKNHLGLFFLLVPALTINYIDHLTGCKERVSSRSSAARFGSLLSDDGFALGVAFLLTVLGQVCDYNKLDWLKQTCAKLQQDIDEVEKRLGSAKYEESLRQTSSMTLRRLNKLHAEYQALDYTLACALLLFGSLT